MLEQRVARLVEKVSGIQTTLARIEAKLDGKADASALARVDGMLSRSPDTGQLWRMIVSTWIAGAGIVFVIIRFAQ